MNNPCGWKCKWISSAIFSEGPVTVFGERFDLHSETCIIRLVTHFPIWLLVNAVNVENIILSTILYMAWR